MKQAGAILHVATRTVAFHKYRIMRDSTSRTTRTLRFAITKSGSVEARPGRLRARNPLPSREARRNNAQNLLQAPAAPVPGDARILTLFR
jgi:hypothetical protein